MSVVEAGESAPDVNTIDGFSAAIEAAAAAAKDTGPATTEGQLAGLSDGVAAGITIPAEATEEGAEPVVEATPVEGAADPVVPKEGEGLEDPKVAALIERYGSIEKALEAAVEAQSLLGRQGNELGELRKRLDAIEKPAEEQVVVPSFPEQALITEEVKEWASDAVAQNGGQNVVVWAINNNPTLYDAAIAAWEDAEREEAEEAGRSSKGEARQFDRAFQREMAKIEAEATLAAATPQASEDATQAQAVAINESIAAIKPSIPDWDAIEPLLEEALEDGEQIVRDLIISPDAEDREAGLKILASVARGKLSAAQATALASGAGKEKREAALIAAGVGAGSLAPGTPEGTDTDREKQIADWKQATFFGTPGRKK